MADDAKKIVEDTMAEVKKAAPKRKRKTVAKRKPAVKRKPAAKKSTKRSSSEFVSRAREVSREAFLASLGFYGKAYDQVQEQFSNMQDQLEERRGKADDLYRELVKRGEKVEKDARKAIDDLDLPKLELDSLADRKKLEKQMNKAKERFEELKERFRKAA